MIIVMLGPPGSGKGTQCELLAEQLDIPHVSTGDLLREAITRQTELGKYAKPFMDRGELVPDAAITGMVKERLQREDARRGVLLDGFPRTIEQAQALDDMLAQLGRRINRVINLQVADDELVQRISGRYTCGDCGATYHLRSSPPRVADVCDRCGSRLHQRSDDRPEVVRRRLEVYHQRTAPLIDYFRNQAILAEVDGAQGVNQVLRAEIEIIGIHAATS